MIAYVERAMPHIGNGATSETQVCVPARIKPMAKPEVLLPPRNSAGDVDPSSPDASITPEIGQAFDIGSPAFLCCR
jgi:hypothetical protein